MARHLLAILGYVLATLVVVGGTLLLIAYGNGYSYDLKNGKLIHRGLIIINSIPSGAKVSLNGKPTKKNTPYRNTFEAGWYNFTVEKTGYRTWTKRLEAVPSLANLVQYIILMPQHIGVESVGTYPAISQSVPSRDHRRVALNVTGGTSPGIYSLDTSSHDQTRVYSPAAATPDTPAETVEVLSWSDDNSHLLIRSHVADKTSLVVIGANGSDQPINITDLMKIDATTLTFDPSNWRQLYWLNQDGLRRIDLGNQTISAVLADNVSTFTFASDRILYVNLLPDKPASLWALDRGGHKTELVSKLPAGTVYSLDFATYVGTTEAVVVASDTHAAALYSDLYNKPTETKLAASAARASFNGDGRFVFLTDDTHLATYDLQDETMNVLGGINSTVTNLTWFDNYHLLFSRGGQVVLSEYDGNYAIAITRGDGLGAYSAPDGKSVFATAPTSSGSTQVKAVLIRQ